MVKKLFPKIKLFLFNLKTWQLVLLTTMINICNRTWSRNMILIEVLHETNLLYLQAIKWWKSKFPPFATSLNIFDRSLRSLFQIFPKNQTSRLSYSVKCSTQWNQLSLSPSVERSLPKLPLSRFAKLCRWLLSAGYFMLVCVAAFV